MKYIRWSSIIGHYSLRPPQYSRSSRRRYARVRHVSRLHYITKTSRWMTRDHNKNMYGLHYSGGAKIVRSIVCSNRRGHVDRYRALPKHFQASSFARTEAAVTPSVVTQHPMAVLEPSPTHNARDPGCVHCVVLVAVLFVCCISKETVDSVPSRGVQSTPSEPHGWCASSAALRILRRNLDTRTAMTLPQS